MKRRRVTAMALLWPIVKGYQRPSKLLPEKQFFPQEKFEKNESQNLLSQAPILPSDAKFLSKISARGEGTKRRKTLLHLRPTGQIFLGRNFLKTSSFKC